MTAWVAIFLLLPDIGRAMDAGKFEVYCVKEAFCVEAVNGADGTKLVLTTTKIGDISFRLDGPADEFSPSAGFPVIVSARRATSMELTVLRKFDPKKIDRLKFEFKWGRYDAELKDNVFGLPYDSKNSFPILQGYNSGRTHSGEKQWGVDFGMTEGMEVLAAREGVVVKVAQDFNQTAIVPDDSPNANVILVLHDDGTVSNYFHLLYKSASVQVGERVSSGQKIARSGMTGEVKAPHLHFDVYKPINWTNSRRTLPIKFKLPSGKVLSDPQVNLPYP